MSNSLTMQDVRKRLAKRFAPIAKLKDSLIQLEQATALVETICQNETWLQEVEIEINESQGWTLVPLFTKSNHQFGAFLTGWLPGRGAPPHTHGGWTVVGGIRGVELNTMWQRLDDGVTPGEAKIEVLRKDLIEPGNVLVMPNEDDIHSVSNPGERPSLTLHCYQNHPDFAERFLFDPSQNLVEPFITVPVGDAS